MSLERVASFGLALLAPALLAGAGEPLVVTIEGPDPLIVYEEMPQIEGRTSAEPGAGIEVRLAGRIARGEIEPSGRWRARFAEPVPPGTWTATVIVREEGREASVSRSIRVETEGHLPRRPLLDPHAPRPAPPPSLPETDFHESVDRWRIVPPGERELRLRPLPLDPYEQNPIKGDVPLFGDRVFLSLTGISDTLVESRNVPTPAGASTARPGSLEFFGEGDQLFLSQTLLVSADLYRGLTTFRPADWRVRATIVASLNHLDVRETAVVNPDVRRGTDRTDGQLSLQELFYERKLADLSPNFDFVSIRAGIQPFNSDFRGFIFNDTNLGVRLFGTWDDNRFQYNLAYFERLEKDTNSGLNEIDRLRGQRVAVANLYRQDFMRPGHTIEISAHWMQDDGGIHFDANGLLVRPDPVGSSVPHQIDAVWLGAASFGRLGRINVDGAAYWVVGRDSLNPIAGVDPIGGGVGTGGAARGRDSVDVSAGMFALELSIDRDWIRPRLGIFLASGDDDPSDRDAEGFDAIFSNPAFAGGGFSFWNRIGIRLPATGVGLVHRGSLLPDLNSSKDEGQPNFVNPGIRILTAGLDLELTPRTRLLLNANHLRFAESPVLEGLLFQDGIDSDLGLDLSAGIRHRPWLNNTVMLVGGAAAFVPGRGFEDIYDDDGVLYQIFTNVILTF